MRVNTLLLVGVVVVVWTQSAHGLYEEQAGVEDWCVSTDWYHSRIDYNYGFCCEHVRVFSAPFLDGGKGKYDCTRDSRTASVAFHCKRDTMPKLRGARVHASSFANYVVSATDR